MKTNITTIALILCFIKGMIGQGDLGSNYIETYKIFYPTKVLGMGIQSSLWDYEDLSAASIKSWLTYNENTLKILRNEESSFNAENPIDARLLRLQVLAEIDKWGSKKVHETRLSAYSSLISNALNKVLSNNFLTPKEQSNLICKRLDAVIKLCQAAEIALTGLQKKDFDSSIAQLEKAAKRYRSEFSSQFKHLSTHSNCGSLESKSNEIAEAILSLINHVQISLSPENSNKNLAIGQDEYAQRLSLYTDSKLTPAELDKMALEEIELTKDLMLKVSKDILNRTFPDRKMPSERDEVIKLALMEIEKDVPSSGADYLEFWLELRDATLKFIEENEIVTLPDFQTLRIMNAPESAGPAARIGWVGVAPSFDPNPVTTLYLPSIPDTLPLKEQKEFWASFNKPFNRMIVIHELIPGHYHQKKIFRETPHHIRLFFPYALYTEGYATFTERVLLEAGWESDDPLTYLAHLRKRLENANRAYTSVQMHCNNWTEEMVWKFSVETSLLAPQFAKSLWGRISQRPMQVISYFLGSREFSELYDKERIRLGDAFNLKAFMDTILTIGPIPTDEYYEIFQDKYPSE